MNRVMTAAAFSCLLATTAYAQSNTAVGTGVGIAGSSSKIRRRRHLRSGRPRRQFLAHHQQPGEHDLDGQYATSQRETTQNLNQKVSGGTRNENIASGTTTVKNVPSTVAPGLAAAGLETCLGSASGTVSAVGFGIGGGSTYRDEDCTARLDSRTLFAMGLKSAAVARLCVRPDIWRSMPDICAQYWPAGPAAAAGHLYRGAAGGAVGHLHVGVNPRDRRPRWRREGLRELQRHQAEVLPVGWGSSAPAADCGDDAAAAGATKPAQASRRSSHRPRRRSRPPCRPVRSGSGTTRRTA